MSETTYSFSAYTGDGTIAVYAVGFDYLQRAHVKVTVDGTEQLDGTNYDWTGDKQITFQDGSIPANGTEIRIVRDTPEADQIVQWRDGSYIISEDLNESDLQWLYNIQELYDSTTHMSDQVFPGVTGLITEEEAELNPDDPAWSGDAQIPTVGAVERIYGNIVGTAADYPGNGNLGKHGKLRIDHNATLPDLYFWNGQLNPPAWQQVATQGQAGAQGPKGDPPGLQTPSTSVSTIFNNADGTAGNANADVSQDSVGDMLFTFEIPVGPRGEKGDAGDGGPAATVDVGTTTTGNAGTDASVTNSGTTSAAVFNFTIPRGNTGEAGPAPGLHSTPATATNVANIDATTLGNATASVTKDDDDLLQFQFGIPVGLKGDKGDTGTGITYKGVANITSSAAEPNSPINGDYWVNNTDGTGAWTGVSGAVVQGDRVIYNGVTSQWDLLPSASTKVDLGYTPATDRGTVVNSGGADATVTAVTDTNAGLMLPGQKIKLDGIDTGAEANWAEPPDNGSLYARTRGAGSTDGTWQQIPSAVVESVTGGSGIEVTGTTTREVAIDYGQGVEADDSSQLTVKLDGTTLSKSDNGLRVASDYNAPTAGSADQLTNARTLWGQSFNGTANVSGDMTSVGDITFSGAQTLSTGGDNGLTFNTGTADAVFSADVQIQGGNGIQLNNDDNDASVRHLAQGDLAANAVYTWPAAPAGNMLLQSSNTGALSWVEGLLWTRDDDTNTLSPGTASDNVSIGGDLTLTGVGETLVFTGSDNTPTNRTITVQAPTSDATFAADYTLTLPNSPGVAGQVLSTNGTGGLSWTAPTATSTGQIARTGVTSANNSNYNILLGESENTATNSRAYVRTDAAHCWYNPSTDTLGGVGTFAGASQQLIRRQALTSDNTSYRIMLAGASDQEGGTDAFVVTDASRLFYNPSTSTVGGVTRFAGRADTVNITVDTGSGLSGGGLLNQNRNLTVDSTVIRTSGAQSMSGTKTFTGKLVFSGSGTLTNKANTNPPTSGKAENAGIWLTSNTIYAIGNTNKGLVVGNDNVTDNWATVVNFINGGSGSAGKIECKKQQEPRFGANSDRRLKSNIVDAESMLEKFEAIQVRRFTIASPDPDETPTDNQLGFIADELQQVFPDAVDGEPNAVMVMGNVVDSEGNVIDTDVEDPATSGYHLEEDQTFVAGKTAVPKYQTVATSALTVPMAKAIQELIAQNKALAARIDALEGA